jgi:hypothetical protein
LVTPELCQPLLDEAPLGVRVDELEVDAIESAQQLRQRSVVDRG